MFGIITFMYALGALLGLWGINPLAVWLLVGFSFMEAIFWVWSTTV